jgi:hypothetical protein
MQAGLRSGDVSSGGGEMALEALEKPPFAAIFQHFCLQFSPGFSAALPRSAQIGANSVPRRAWFKRDHFRSTPGLSARPEIGAAS